MAAPTRSRVRLLTAAATVALAALSLTACDNGDGVRDEGASQQPSKSAPADGDSGKDTSAGSTTDDKTGTGTGTKPKPQPASTGKNNPTASTARVTCNGSTVKVTAQSVSRPVNHMLLTVTNTGSKRCDLYGYPAVRFGEAQSVPPVIDDSQPQAVVSLPPGQSAYAGVALSGGDDGGGSNGRTEKTLEVFFQGRNTNDGGPGAKAALPAKGVYIDDSLKVTYWQQSMSDALTW
ncbi:DUF4232 domain-containing protein [Streptomyces sp. AcE210]|uniref:DUF4232 domain-containing protein n=1 Tax=Streptomyces sp. AcE210 TaxID=2292703 RepID=UPI000E307ABF|nr:DUF4232 domain-containing protein [Streptomyces sp. AcE210]RFC74828.1 DUF4232 domain-containing protein [Streptomyces sp. AcE210]